LEVGSRDIAMLGDKGHIATNVCKQKGAELWLVRMVYFR
jgi:hypothetical protein